MVAGAYMQNKAQQDAAGRQQRQIQAELQRQQQFQQQAEKAALDRVQDFAPEERQQRQQQLEQQVTDQLMQPVQQNQQAMQDQSAVQGNVSSDYTAAKAQSQKDQLDTAAELARIMGKITGANRLRQDEALNMLSTGQQIDQLKNFSRGSQAVNQLETQEAGVPNGGLSLAGSLAQTLGSVGLMSGLGSAGSLGAGSSTTSTALGTGVGADASKSILSGGPLVGKTTGGLGLKLPV